VLSTRLAAKTTDREEGMPMNKLLTAIVASAVVAAGCAASAAPVEDPGADGAPARTEVFEYSSNGVVTRGKIYLPESYDRSMDLPAIYLVDFTEQHYEVALDEFEKVIEAVARVEGVNALVVTLEERPDVDAGPYTFRQHYELFRDMARHVDGTYTDNPSRTFIGRGSEAGIVLFSLFGGDPQAAVFDNFVVTDPSPQYASAVIDILEDGEAPEATTGKRLHFSFSTSNDYFKSTKLIDLISEADFPWLQFASVYYSDLEYEETYPVSFAAGLEFVFGE
jgi:hypothetical protein